MKLAHPALAFALVAPSFATQDLLSHTQVLELGLTDGFGWSVDLDGVRAIAGGIRLNDYTGVAYVFELVNGSWVFDSQLFPSNIAPGDWFGQSVAIDGDLAVVGTTGPHVGSAGRPAYVFRKEAGAWTEAAVLYAVNQTQVSVDVSDGTIVVNGNPGTTVFRPEGSTWVVEADLVSPAGGGQLALDGDVLAIGSGGGLNQSGVSTGVVAVFRRSAGTWSAPQMVEGSDSVVGDGFGVSVAIDGTTLAVGAFTADPVAESSGAAYVFEFDGLEWQEQAKLVPSNGAGLDYFGQSVAVRGARVVVGAHRADYVGPEKGLGYLFEYTGTVWEESAWLLPEAENNRLAGFDVALSDGQALVGSPGEIAHGRVYTYALGRGITRYCPSVVNSTGAPARIDGLGSSSVSTNDFALTGSSLPPHTVVLAIYGVNSAQFPLGDGFLCINPFAPGLVRLHTAQAQSNGTMQCPLDFPTLPASGHITAGSSWNFQLWYRDAVSGGTGSNLSDALNVSFTH